MMSLSEAARTLDARLSGADVRFSGVSTDSRATARGDLFVALRGERFDGHTFLEAAWRAGAVAALVERGYGGPLPLPALAVDSTLVALGRLAKHWRERFSPAMVAITGSNGKTTTKEMLAAVLRQYAGDVSVLATAGNLNNAIGVPLTLLRLRPTHRYCAIELGMNHRGEIAYLADLVRPTVALVNNAQREHLEFLRSVEEVAAENASVYASLAPGGVAVINADDPYAEYFRECAAAQRVLDFGLQAPAAVAGGYALKPLTSDIRLSLPDGQCAATLMIPGVHNVRNALAAAACAHAAGITPPAICAGLSAFRPYAGRLEVKHATGGAIVIDDSYNANPDSVRAAIDILAACASPTLLVLGDMGEVGEQGAEFHREVGDYARACNISRLFALGKASSHAVAAFGAAGLHASTVEELVRALRYALVPEATVLVKGSRFMRMERIVAALVNATMPSGEAH